MLPPGVLPPDDRHYEGDQVLLPIGAQSRGQEPIGHVFELPNVLRAHFSRKIEKDATDETLG